MTFNPLYFIVIYRNHKSYQRLRFFASEDLELHHRLNTDALINIKLGIDIEENKVLSFKHRYAQVLLYRLFRCADKRPLFLNFNDKKGV